MRSAFSMSRIISQVYGGVSNERFRRLLRKWVSAMEGGCAVSSTVRELYRKFHGIEVGPYTAGPFGIKPQYLHRGTSFGRYVDVAATVRTFTRHHPRDRRSTHGLFYNPELGWASGSRSSHNSLRIGHGVHLGENVIILHPAAEIGVGAIIAAGSVVYTDIPPYARASGNPAVVTGYRYDKATIARLLESRWWEVDPEALARGWPHAISEDVEARPAQPAA